MVQQYYNYLIWAQNLLELCICICYVCYESVEVVGTFKPQLSMAPKYSFFCFYNNNLEKDVYSQKEAIVIYIGLMLFIWKLIEYAIFKYIVVL